MVSSNGQHYVTDVIRVNKITINASPVYDYAELLSPVEYKALYDILTNYVKKVLDALGIQFGAGHNVNTVFFRKWSRLCTICEIALSLVINIDSKRIEKKKVIK